MWLQEAIRFVQVWCQNVTTQKIPKCQYMWRSGCETPRRRYWAWQWALDNKKKLQQVDTLHFSQSSAAEVNQSEQTMETNFNLNGDFPLTNCSNGTSNNGESPSALLARTKYWHGGHLITENSHNLPRQQLRSTKDFGFGFGVSFGFFTIRCLVIFHNSLPLSSYR